MILQESSTKRGSLVDQRGPNKVTVIRCSTFIIVVYIPIYKVSIYLANTSYYTRTNHPTWLKLFQEIGFVAFPQLTTECWLHNSTLIPTLKGPTLQK